MASQALFSHRPFEERIAAKSGQCRAAVLF
jgi:hypothetical protein